MFYCFTLSIRPRPPISDSFQPPHPRHGGGSCRAWQNKPVAENATRISSHPEVNFTVVINPGNGPGPNSLPDANYTREVPALASYPNVRLLGYVHTTYATRNISLARRDIETYAAWPTASSNPNMTVRGIFFDETPQEYSAQSLAYLRNLTDLVKDQDGFGQDPFVSWNYQFFSFCPFLFESPFLVLLHATSPSTSLALFVSGFRACS